MAKSVFTEVPKSNYHEPAIETNFAEFKKVVGSRRSVRIYEAEPIPDAVVQECLELALLAPNSSNLQTWKFYWVKTKSLKDRLAEACFGQNAATTAPTLIVCAVDTGAWKSHAREIAADLQKQNAPANSVKYYTKISPFVYTQGFFGLLGLLKKIVFAVMGLWRPVPRDPTSLAGLKLWAHKSCALACENLMLAFRAAGYDSCPMEGFDEVRVRGALGLPRKISVVMVISAGKRARNGIYGPQTRFESSRFITQL